MGTNSNIIPKTSEKMEWILFKKPENDWYHQDLIKRGLRHFYNNGLGVYEDYYTSAEYNVKYFGPCQDNTVYGWRNLVVFDDYHNRSYQSIIFDWDTEAVSKIDQITLYHDEKKREQFCSVDWPKVFSEKLFAYILSYANKTLTEIGPVSVYLTTKGQVVAANQSAWNMPKAYSDSVYAIPLVEFAPILTRFDSLSDGAELIYHQLQEMYTSRFSVGVRIDPFMPEFEFLEKRYTVPDVIPFEEMEFKTITIPCRVPTHQLVKEGIETCNSLFVEIMHDMLSGNVDVSSVRNVVDFIHEDYQKVQERFSKCSNTAQISLSQKFISYLSALQEKLDSLLHTVNDKKINQFEFELQVESQFLKSIRPL